MAKRRRGNVVNGWLILDKPIGMSSTQAVGAVRRAYNAQKAGHAGTLDPLASGILPIALGEATKTVPFAVDGEKVYRFAVRWGAETTTDDAEGPVSAMSHQRPSREAIEALLPSFTGQILQVPPQFSAIKVDGARAYDLARDGEVVDLEARPVTIDRLSIEAMPDADTTMFVAECGRGTYVRSIARDMGRILGCYGHVVDLRRTRVAGFDESVAVSLSDLRADADLEDASAVMAHLLPIEAALDGIIGLPVSSDDAARLHRGQSVLIRGRDAPIMAGEAYAICKGHLIALGAIEKGEFHPNRVFNLL